MAIAVADSGNAHVSRAANGTSAGITTTGATWLGAVVTDANTVPTVTDSYGNTWVATLTERAGVFSSRTRLCYVENPTVGAGHTFTQSGPDAPGGVFLALTGVKTSATAFDQTAGAATQSSPAQAGSVTPSEDNEVVVAAIGGFNTGTYSIDGGFSVIQQLAGVGGVNYSSAVAILVQTSAAAANPSWTVTANASGLTNATFKAVPSGGGTGLLPRLQSEGLFASGMAA